MLALYVEMLRTLSVVSILSSVKVFRTLESIVVICRFSAQCLVLKNKFINCFAVQKKHDPTKDVFICEGTYNNKTQ